MITITPQAAAQIRTAAKEGNMEKMSLRLAAKKNQEGAIEYGMGFDDKGPSDMEVVSEEIEVIIYDEHVPLLRGTTLDFVELTPGEFQFIFINPNDPAQQTVSEENTST
ncbi:MAG: iron-sulfur cluster assembly accessory protein [Gammaproteobacteria bacterium]|nr:iron-sulfur cluster assembly accessory protein [Gammaproteobacteria bacterium]MDH5594207.1 iron-sulfur cluster assembly accessory protein [Gammaproteobacteria bacterium]MDH5614445.1 iron-sulfur cluster assembly accessory protein [Gammaproteobacteria bacterium]